MGPETWRVSVALMRTTSQLSSRKKMVRLHLGTWTSGASRCGTRPSFFLLSFSWITCFSRMKEVLSAALTQRLFAGSNVVTSIAVVHSSHAIAHSRKGTVMVIMTTKRYAPEGLFATAHGFQDKHSM